MHQAHSVLPARKLAAQVATALLLSGTLSLTGCGSSSGPAPHPTPVAGTPDLGTLSAVSDSFQDKIKNVSSGQLLGIAGQSQLAGASMDQADDTGTPDQLWHFIPMGNNQFNVENLLTHQVAGIAAASTASGALGLQYADNGTNDHLWGFYLLQDGNYLLKNANSNLYLQIDTTLSPARIDQAARATTGAGCTCQEWTLTSTSVSPYPAPLAVTGSGVYVHDPNMIEDQSHVFWLYGTHNTLASSPDMSAFTQVAAGDINPDFSWWASKNTTGGNGRTDIWAPSVMFANGTYYQYYSVPVYTNPAVAGSNSGPEAVIALATSTNPNGPWTDAGQIISSCGTTAGCTTTFNAIDPAPFIDGAGNWWLSFGSYSDGIHILQLDPTTGLRLASNMAQPVIAFRGAGEEGSFIFPYTVNGTLYYFYFAPIDACCAGSSSTYRIITGRSTSPTGPFLDRGGLDLVNGGGTILLSAHDRINGPGGQSVVMNGTQPVLVYHYYDGNASGTPTLGLNNLMFDADGWPHIQ